MFQTCDYRNLRYQGEVQNDLPHGIGIIFDYNQLFCLAQWREGLMHGPVFAISPDSKIFCGRIKNDQLEGICSIYLPDRIQILGNYSQEKDRKDNFIAVLQFIKVILQIEPRDNKPRVSQHIKYTPETQSYQKKLANMLKRNVDLSEFSSWKQFVNLNFVASYSQSLYWKQKIGDEKEQIFIGLRSSGLGVKININSENVAIQCDGDFFVIIQMGVFSSLHELTGFGKKRVQYSHSKIEQESYYQQGEKIGEVVQYPRKKRHKKGQKLFANKLKSSIFFINSFFNVNRLYSIFSSYSKINVNLVEQTQKIAQVVIENNQDSIILAEIENKKHRRTTPQKNTITTIDSEYKRVEQDINQNVGIETLFVNPQSKKSIYSSVEKKRKNKNSPVGSPARKYTYEQNGSFNIANNNYQKNKKPSQDYKLLLEDPSFRQIYTKYSNPLRNRNAHSTKYIEAPPIRRQESIYQPNRHKKSKSPNDQQKYERSPPTLNLSYQRPAYKYMNKHTPQRPVAREREQSPPLHNRYYERQSPKFKYDQRQDQKLINFFNKKIEDETPSFSQHNQAYIQQPLEQLNRRNREMARAQRRKKSPGKILTYKKS